MSSSDTINIARVLQMKGFRRSLKNSASYETTLEELLLQTIAPLNADAGAIYVFETDKHLPFGNINQHWASKSALRRLVRESDLENDLLIDTGDCIAAKLWQNGDVAGAICLCYKQGDHPGESFSAYDKSLLIALAATASLALENHKLAQQNDQLQATSTDSERETGIIGNSNAVLEILSRIERYVRQRVNQAILITGETGTGKDLVAGAIHRQSHRRQKKYVVINCAAIPENLIESELFGHKKGAFTGANFDKPGKLEDADGGTLFLDEIGDMPLDAQAKLLRAIESGKFERIGDNVERKADFQLVAATNKDLNKAVTERKFREDLFYRLNGYPIEILPLRDRIEDIPQLVQFFLVKLNQESGKKKITGVTPAGLHFLQQCEWRGNIRQLRNVVRNAYVNCDEPTLDARHFKDIFEEPDNGKALKFTAVIPLEAAISEYVRFAYEKNGGHSTNTMKQLEVDHRRLMRYLGERLEKKLILPFKPRIELQAIAEADRLFEKFSLPEVHRNGLKRAMIEAIINAVAHSQSPDEEVVVHFSVTPRKFQIQVIDNGQGFDVSQIKPVQLNQKLEENRLSGWGLYLIKNAVEDVDIQSNSNGTRITFTVDRKSQE